jgi:hypothetical protein
MTKYLGAVLSSSTTSNRQKIETTKPFFSLKNTRHLSTNCQFCQQNKMNKTTKNRPSSETDYQTNKNPRALSSIDSKSGTYRLRFFSSAPWCRCPSNKKCWKSNNFTQRKPLCFVTNTDLQKEKNDPTTGQVRNRKNLIKLVPSECFQVVRVVADLCQRPWIEDLLDLTDQRSQPLATKNQQ